MARPRAWADLIWSAAIANNADVPPLDILFDLGSSRLDTITIVRLVGSFHLTHDVTLGITEGIQRVDLGIGVCSQSAFDAGNMPRADISTSYPPRGWLYADTMWVTTDASVADRIVPSWKIDIRTMRKLDKGILYLTLSNNNVIGSGQGVVLGGRIRALCLT